MLKYKPDFVIAQDRWDAFWNKQIIDRPCTCIWVNNDVRYPFIPRLISIGTTTYDDIFSISDNYFENNEFLGETMPLFRPGFGPDQVAGFLGAPITISPYSNDTSWSEKIVEDWESFLPLKIDENAPCWKKMHDFHRAAEKYVDGKCLLSNIDLHTNIDGLEALRGAQKLLFDIIDQPDIVLQAMMQIRKLYPIIYDAFYGYGNKKKLGTTVPWHFYSRGKCQWVQADFICLLTPDMVRKFVLPAIEEEAFFLDHCCFHLDGPGALAHLDEILAIEKIHAIGWVPGEGNKPQIEWEDLFHKIQNAGKTVLLYGEPEQIKAVHGKYKPDLVAYYVSTNSVDEAKQLLDWLEKNT